MELRFVKLITFLLVVFCCGCITTGTNFTPDNYQNNLFPYKVDNNEHGFLLSQKWKLDNYKLDSNGTPKKIKKGPDYEVNLILEDDSILAVDNQKKYPTYDLSFINRRDDGVIWLRTIPLSWDMSQTKLRVMLKRVVEAMAGEGLIAKKIDPQTIKANSVRYATKIISSESAMVYGHEAYTAIVEIANIDQLKLSPDSRWHRAELVLIRTHYLWQPVGLTKRYYPVLMMAGYSNLPEDFDSGRSEFYDFLKRIKLSTYPALTKEEEALVLKCTPGSDVVRLIAKTNYSDKDIYNDNKAKSFMFNSPDLTEEQLSCINKNTFKVESGKMYLVTKTKPENIRETKLPELKRNIAGVSNKHN